jgi:hypothetical protein
MKLFSQSLILVLSYIIVYIWVQSPLANYTIPLLGFLIFIYLLLSARKKGKSFLNMGGEGPWGIFVLNTLIFLLIFSTDGIYSPIFFLLYFLGFGIAFVFEPSAVFIFIIGAILVFLPQALKDDVSGNMLRLGSLILISPLAFFFGNEYRKTDRQTADIEAIVEREKEAADVIAEDIDEVLEDEKQTLKEKDVEKLNEVLEETEDLRQESKKDL